MHFDQFHVISVLFKRVYNSNQFVLSVYNTRTCKSTCHVLKLELARYVVIYVQGVLMAQTNWLCEKTSKRGPVRLYKHDIYFLCLFDNINVYGPQFSRTDRVTWKKRSYISCDQLLQQL